MAKQRKNTAKQPPSADAVAAVNVPRWHKGMASPNPHGRGVSKMLSGTLPEQTNPSKPSGSDGTAIYAGYIYLNERRPELTLINKWRTFDNMILDVALVASVVNVWTTLGGSGKWTAEPNPRGGKDAERGAEIVTEGLLNAQLNTPWTTVVRRQLMKKLRGFALHEALVRRRDDGMVIYKDIQHRPQWTIDRWDKPDEQTDWIGVSQLTRTGKRFYIPRERLFYSVENTLTDSPDGVGVLRLIAETVRRLQIYQELEGVGLQTDLRGIPIVRVPLADLREQARAAGCGDDETKIKAYIDAQVSDLRTFIVAHNKNPEQGLLFGSDTYTTKDEAQSPSSIYKWSAELLSSASSSLPDARAAIARELAEVARIMCAEWLLLGGEDAGGAYSMHEDKTAMFCLMLNAGRKDLATDAQRDLAARLIALNGLDPETCTPTLVPEPVATQSVEVAARTLLALQQAGLHPRDKAMNVLRGRMDLPDAPDIDLTDWMLPRGAVVVPDADPTSVPPAPPGAGKPAPKPDANKPGNVAAQQTPEDAPPKKRRRSA